MREYIQETIDGELVARFYSHIEAGELAPVGSRRLLGENYQGMSTGQSCRFTGTTYLIRIK